MEMALEDVRQQLEDTCDDLGLEARKLRLEKTKLIASIEDLSSQIDDVESHMNKESIYMTRKRRIFDQLMIKMRFSIFSLGKSVIKILKEAGISENIVHEVNKRIHLKDGSHKLPPPKSRSII